MPGNFSSAQLVAAGMKLTSSIGTTTLDTSGYGFLQAVCTVVTTSGTVASFGAWVEGTIDGDNWFPVPFDSVVQQRSGVTVTNWTALGTNASPTVTTAGLPIIMLANMAAATTGSACTIGMRKGGLPLKVRAAYAIVPGSGAINFVIDAMVTT